MNCKKVMRLLNMYADNELLEETKSSVQNHLAGCEKCAKALNEIDKLKNLVGTTPQYTANPFLWTRIAEGIKGLEPKTIGIPVPSLLHVWIYAASILIVLSGLVIYKVYEPDKDIDLDQTSITNPVLEIPITPENMERVTLNLLVYTNGKLMEVPYVKF